MSKKKKSRKQKVRYIKQKETRDSSGLRRDINDLKKEKEKIASAAERASKKKKGLGKVWIGIKGSLRQSSLNKQLRQKQIALRRPEQIRELKDRIELAKQKQKLDALRKKNNQNLSFESLGGKGLKSIKFEDLS